MNLSELLLLQKQLDIKIEEKNNGSFFQEKVLAFFVEVGELANEIKCFKYWSTKQPSSDEIILEEYVDGLHFLLSIGLDLGYGERLITEELELPYGKIPKEEITKRLLNIMSLVSEFNIRNNYFMYLNLIRSYFSLGYELGFSNNEIKMAYRRKNELNHKRQEQGY